MSQFHPTNITVEPPPLPDYLAGAVLQGLSRPIGAKLSWGVVKSVVLGALSFGLLPILSWGGRFRRFAIAEQQQFLHLAQWVRMNSAHPLARRLESDAGELRPRGFLSLVTLLLAVATAGTIGFLINQPHHLRWDELLAGTYGFHKARVLDFPVRIRPDSRMIYTLWCYGLGAAYLLHFLQVYLHSVDVKRFVARFSEIAQAEGINRVKADSIGIMVWPLWLAAGFAFFVAGAPWGIMAMLAGGAHRRYITWTSRNTRGDLANRLRAMLLRRRPSANVPLPVYLRDRCIQPRCRAELPRGVNFCTRCGTPQKASVNRVA